MKFTHKDINEKTSLEITLEGDRIAIVAKNEKGSAGIAGSLVDIVLALGKLIEKNI